MSQTQPQLAYAVNRLCIYMQREPDIAYGMIIRIYLSLRDQRWIFFPSNVDWRTIPLQTYADADLGKCKFTRRSRSGKLQYITESETIAMSAAARNTVAIQNFCNELGIPIPQPSTVYGDNQGSILTTTNGFGSLRSRHLSLRHHYIVELERTGRITSRKIRTAENLADVFTKALPAPQYLKLIDQFTVRLSDYLRESDDSTNFCQLSCCGYFGLLLQLTSVFISLTFQVVDDSTDFLPECKKCGDLVARNDFEDHILLTCAYKIDITHTGNSRTCKKTSSAGASFVFFQPLLPAQPQLRTSVNVARHLNQHKALGTTLTAASLNPTNTKCLCLENPNRYLTLTNKLT
eukprot:g7558.t1